MTIKLDTSLSFRKQTEGKSLGSVMAEATYVGQLFTFHYHSFGPKHRGWNYRYGTKVKGTSVRLSSPVRNKRVKPRTANKDKYPLLLLAFKNGKKVWKAENGKKYVYGFNLNYLPNDRRLEFVEKLRDVVLEQPGLEMSYRDLLAKFGLPHRVGDTIFRKYDVRGSKLRGFKEVDLDTYIIQLSSALDRETL